MRYDPQSRVRVFRTGRWVVADWRFVIKRKWPVGLARRHRGVVEEIIIMKHLQVVLRSCEEGPTIATYLVTRNPAPRIQNGPLVDNFLLQLFLSGSFPPGGRCPVSDAMAGKLIAISEMYILNKRIVGVIVTIEESQADLTPVWIHSAIKDISVVSFVIVPSEGIIKVDGDYLRYGAFIVVTTGYFFTGTETIGKLAGIVVTRLSWGLARGKRNK